MDVNFLIDIFIQYILYQRNIFSMSVEELGDRIAVDYIEDQMLVYLDNERVLIVDVIRRPDGRFNYQFHRPQENEQCITKNNTCLTALKGEEKEKHPKSLLVIQPTLC